MPPRQKEDKQVAEVSRALLNAVLQREFGMGLGYGGRQLTYIRGRRFELGQNLVVAQIWTGCDSKTGLPFPKGKDSLEIILKRADIAQTKQAILLVAKHTHRFGKNPIQPLRKKVSAVIDLVDYAESCERCGRVMIPIYNTGGTPHEVFWGCSGFPDFCEFRRYDLVPRATAVILKENFKFCHPIQPSGLARKALT
jgi:hypothetical protein